ncbi:MAG: 6-phosphogluconolactonase [Myxococcota bacterium]
MSADFVAEFVARVRAGSGVFTCALTGGSAASALYPLLRDVELDWSRVHFFLSDERCVPLDHPDSNYRALRAALPRARLEPVRTELPPAEAAREYAARLPAQLDLVHLGLGPDGHVASLFPGHALLGEREVRVAALTDSPKPPAARVTFTLPTLFAAREVWFLVVGGAKRPVVEAVRHDPTCSFPAALVERGARSTTWFLQY